MKRILLGTVAAISLSFPAIADEVSDTIQSALDAYTQGDTNYAMEELAFAQQLLRQMQVANFSTLQPEAPDGWTREINTEMNAGMAMFGGGAGTEATFSNGTDSFKITMMVNNPMVASMAGILGNTQMMGVMGKVIRVGRQKFMVQDGEVQGIVNNRVLVQASGATPEVMIAILKTIHFKELGQFGQ